MIRSTARNQPQAEVERILTIWVFLFARLRRWLLMAVALPLARMLVHRLAVTDDDHDARSAKLLHRADSAVSAVSRRDSRRRTR
jgi:hypothetical protein